MSNAAAAAPYTESEESAKRCSFRGSRKSSARSADSTRARRGIEVLGEEQVAINDMVIYGSSSIVQARSQLGAIDEYRLIVNRSISAQDGRSSKGSTFAN